MSTATAEAPDAAPPRQRNRKKLLFLLVLLLALLGGGGAGAWFWLRPAAAAGATTAKQAHKSPPAFLPMENFVVNLADRESERFAQIGVTLELEGPEALEKFRVYLPVIRSQVLLLIAHKSPADLLERQGKEQLAGEIVREALRAVGEPGDGNPAAPAIRVHFSSFIIQ